MSLGDHPARTPAVGEGWRPGSGPHSCLKLLGNAAWSPTARRSLRLGTPGPDGLLPWFPQAERAAPHCGPERMGEASGEAGQGGRLGSEAPESVPTTGRGQAPRAVRACAGPHQSPGLLGGGPWLRPSPGEGADQPPLRATASCTPCQPPGSRVAPGLPLWGVQGGCRRAELLGTAQHLGRGARLLPLNPGSGSGSEACGSASRGSSCPGRRGGPWARPLAGPAPPQRPSCSRRRWRPRQMPSACFSVATSPG